MSSKTTPTLSEKLLGYLRPGAPALMLTTAADGYAGSAYTWVVALDAMRLRFVVDAGSSALTNLQRSDRVAIQIIGPGDLSFLIKGNARQLRERIAAAAPAAVTLWEMCVVAAKDLSWPGVTSTALAYQWPTAQREAMLRMEQAIYAEMRDVGA